MDVETGTLFFKIIDISVSIVIVKTSSDSVSVIKNVQILFSRL